MNFAEKILKFKHANSYASSNGKILFANNPDNLLTFATEPNPDIYCVESTDAIIPAKNGKILYSYAGSNVPAVVYYSNNNQTIVISGFPIETLTSQHQVNQMMCEVIKLMFDR
jgi:hypothetical protein